MRYFVQIAEQVDIVPVRLALAQCSDLWNQYRFRTAPADSPHREVDDIIVRCQPLTADWPDRRECVWYPAWQRLPALRPHVFALLTRVQGLRLGRVLLTRLPPGAQIYPHRDIGPQHYDTEPYWQRFHVLLQCPPEALFQAEDEVVHMPTGSVWWFDNTVEHRVWNDGTVDRLTCIIDIHCGEEIPYAG